MSSPRTLRACFVADNAYKALWAVHVSIIDVRFSKKLELNSHLGLRAMHFFGLYHKEHTVLLIGMKVTKGMKEMD